MSKDKGSKNIKKAPSTDLSKSKSDYQSGKGSVSQDVVAPKNKKK
ncbi:hypothetical protein [Mucilaginibacter sp. CSA2-8R]